MEYSDLLFDEPYKIGVWGAGFIGFSTLAHFARSGVNSTAFDIDEHKVDAINRGVTLGEGMKEWLGFDVEPLVQKGLMEATENHDDLVSPQYLVHFLCIPTEKEGEPFNAALEDVITKLSAYKDVEFDYAPLIIIESTLTPGTTEEIVIPKLQESGLEVGSDVLLGVAPRRDWFVDDTKSLRVLDRVFGGVDQTSGDRMEDVLGIVCENLHRASDHRIAEMVKSFENAYRHVDIALANQLSKAYPDVNVREALELVGTKWNIGTFYPGFGSGGYCIPLSSKYVLDGAMNPDELSILKGTVKTDTEINREIAGSIAERGVSSVGVLGLSYKEDLKVSLQSSTLPFIDELLDRGVEVRLHDPLYSSSEIQEKAGVEWLEFPEGLNDFEAVVLVVGHRFYRNRKTEILDNLDGCAFVLDNPAALTDLKDAFEEKGINYHVSGDEHWLG